MSLENVKNIVLVLSGKGGVGKSSITTQLALSLTLAGYSVGVLDIDLTGPSIPRFLGIEASKIKQAPGGWLPAEVHVSQILPPASPITYSLPEHAVSGVKNDTSISATNSVTTTSSLSNDTTDNLTKSITFNLPVGSLYAMSLAFLLTSRSSAIVWRGPKKTAMVRQFLSDVLWPPLDYLLIDTPPGTSDEHISLVETLLKSTRSEPSSVTGTSKPVPNLTGAILVTTPQAVATSDVRKEINFCGKTGVKVLGVIENMSGYVCECCGLVTNLFGKGGGEVMAGEFKIDFLGSVPVDGRWGALVEEGKRPQYGGVEVDDVEEKEGEDLEEPQKNILEGERDKGLLVDKYRNCSLRPVFEIIMEKLVQTVEKGGGVVPHFKTL